MWPGSKSNRAKLAKGSSWIPHMKNRLRLFFALMSEGMRPLCLKIEILLSCCNRKCMEVFNATCCMLNGDSFLTEAGEITRVLYFF